MFVGVAREIGKTGKNGADLFCYLQGIFQILLLQEPEYLKCVRIEAALSAGLMVQAISPGDALRFAGRALLGLLVAVLGLYAVRTLWTCFFFSRFRLGSRPSRHHFPGSRSASWRSLRFYSSLGSSSSSSDGNSPCDVVRRKGTGMTTTITKLRHADDFEALGHRTMMETGDQIATQNICGLHLQAFTHGLQPLITSMSWVIQVVKNRQHALWSHLYDRLEPVRDAVMLGFTITVGLLGVLILVAALASLAGHTMTFYLFGSGPSVSVIIGVALTGIMTVVGYQAYEKIFVRHKGAEICRTVAFLLCFWALFQMAEARGTMMERLTNSPATQSYVDGGNAEDTPAEPPQGDGSLEQKVRGLLGSAMVKIMIAADIILGILVGRLVKILTDEDFAAWQDLKKSARELAHLEKHLSELQSSIEIAKKRCMAGILRAKHTQRKKCVPYHQALPMLLLAVVLAAPPLFAQTITHHEGILIDVSGSIGKGAADSDLFHEYLFATKKLLLTEPPQSRVWVSVITTESFGSVRSLVKGWTPDAQGVFTDDLNRARHQLAASFEAKSAGLKPAAAGTDIIGGLWQMKALLESGSGSPSTSVSKSIWIFSDMMNESPSFNMPALLATGPENCLPAQRPAVSLSRCMVTKFTSIGASPAGLTPQAWNAVRAFWTVYFREAGAELMTYSAETSAER